MFIVYVENNFVKQQFAGFGDVSRRHPHLWAYQPLIPENRVGTDRAKQNTPDCWMKVNYFPVIPTL